VTACQFLEGDWPEPIGDQQQPIDDAVLEEMLRPSLPTTSDRLFADRRGWTYYEAQLSEDPPRGYVESYVKQLPQKGVLIRGAGGSPHGVLPRVRTYTTLCARPGRTRPFSVRYTEFRSHSELGLEGGDALKSAPVPVRVDGRRLRFALGDRLAEWGERILVPTEDLVSAPELPFPRFPGAVVKDIPLYDLRERGLYLETTATTRVYVAQGKTLEEIGKFYVDEARSVGIDCRQHQDGSVFWRGSSPIGVTGLVVGKRNLSTLGDLGTDLWRLMPQLAVGLPAGVIEFDVRVQFDSNARASQYWPEPERARRYQLQSQGAQE
jgi:hypothetical protein